jgi:hypothetical protein
VPEDEGSTLRHGATRDRQREAQESRRPDEGTVPGVGAQVERESRKEVPPKHQKIHNATCAPAQALAADRTVPQERSTATCRSDQRRSVA